jgi:hypothetical protein
MDKGHQARNGEKNACRSRPAGDGGRSTPTGVRYPPVCRQSYRAQARSYINNSSTLC